MQISHKLTQVQNTKSLKYLCMWFNLRWQLNNMQLLTYFPWQDGEENQKNKSKETHGLR